MAQRITDAINAAVVTARRRRWMGVPCRCSVSSNSSSQVRMLADIQNIDVSVPIQDAKVIINSRTGSVVMNREVTLNSCAIAQGNLSVTVNQSQKVSQPDTPFGGGQTVVTPQTQIDMRQSGGALQTRQCQRQPEQRRACLECAGCYTDGSDVDFAVHAKCRLPARKTGNHLMSDSPISDGMRRMTAAH